MFKPSLTRILIRNNSKRELISYKEVTSRRIEFQFQEYEAGETIS